MRRPPSTPAFDFEELRFDHGDVILAAVGWGEWEMLERSLAEGLACESDAEARGEQVGSAELNAAITAFRRSRRLLAGEEYLSWLGERSLSTADLSAHVMRAALRQRAQARVEEVLRRYPPSAQQLRETIESEAALSGRLRSWSERLARCAGAVRGLSGRDGAAPIDGPGWLRRLLDAGSACRTSGLTEREIGDRAPRIADLLAAAAAFRDLVVTPALIEQRIDEHRLDWQRLVWNEAVFKSEGAAREAALMVKEDGIELGEVAALAHAESGLREAYWSEVPELASLLSGSRPDELLGPLPSAGRWRLVSLTELTPVSAEDPELRERVTRQLVEDALTRHLVGRLSWHVGY